MGKGHFVKNYPMSGRKLVRQHSKQTDNFCEDDLGGNQTFHMKKSQGYKTETPRGKEPRQSPPMSQTS